MSNLRQIVKYIRSDYVRYNGKDTNFLLMIGKAILAKNHCFAYSFWLRLSSKRNIFYPIARIMHYRLSKKYGLQIPRHTKIGYGLYIGHGIGIIVNGTTQIGSNCNLSQFTTIGSNSGNAAVIGDNVYIGPSVCIVESVNIGNNATIGAGAVVVKDIPDDATAVGVPAKVVSYKNPGSNITRRYVQRVSV